MTMTNIDHGAKSPAAQIKYDNASMALALRDLRKSLDAKETSITVNVPKSPASPAPDVHVTVEPAQPTPLTQIIEVPKDAIRVEVIVNSDLKMYLLISTILLVAIQIIDLVCRLRYE